MKKSDAFLRLLLSASCLYAINSFAGKSGIYKDATACLEALQNNDTSVLTLKNQGYSTQNKDFIVPNSMLLALSILDFESKDVTTQLLKEFVETLKSTPLKYDEKNWLHIHSTNNAGMLRQVSLIDPGNAVFHDNSTLNLSRSTYDLNTTQGLMDLKLHIAKLLLIRDMQKNGEYTTEYMRIKSDVKKGLKTMNALIDLLQPKYTPILEDLLVGVDYLNIDKKMQAFKNEVIAQLQLLSFSINKNYASPIPEDVSVLQAAKILIDNISSKNSPGSNPAFTTPVNLKQGSGTIDQRRIIKNALFKEGKEISKVDTYTGYGLEKKMTIPEGYAFEYLKPKTGFGTRAGMRLIIDTNKISKEKLQELSESFSYPLESKVNEEGLIAVKLRIDVESRTGSFLPRIFNAMGFTTNEIHYAGNVNVAYDRNILLEYNSRKEFGTKVRLYTSGPVVHQTQRQVHRDPFVDIQGAILKDGTKVSKTELKRRLFSNLELEFPHEEEANYNALFEDNIASLIIGPASVQFINPNRSSIGPFDWKFMVDSADARGLGLLYGLFNLHDVRSENTRLNIVKKEGLELMLSDLGSGLGTSPGYGRYKGEDINGYAWDFLKIERDLWGIPRRVLMKYFRPNQPNNAAEAMTFRDALRMARVFGKINKEQIQWALVASGYTAPFVIQYTEKIAARRDHMMKELGLTNEFPAMLPNGPNKSLNHDDHTEQLLINLPNGTTHAVRGSKNWVLKDGKIIHRDTGEEHDPKEHRLNHYAF